MSINKEVMNVVWQRFGNSYPISDFQFLNLIEAYEAAKDQYEPAKTEQPVQELPIQPSLKTRVFEIISKWAYASERESTEQIAQRIIDLIKRPEREPLQPDMGCREAFERWLKAFRPSSTIKFEHDGDCFIQPFGNGDAWEAFQAAWNGMDVNRQKHTDELDSARKAVLGAAGVKHD